MLGTFLDKLNTLFDRRYVIAYWGPIFIMCGLAGAVIAWILGPVVVLESWTRSTATLQVIAGVGLMLSITVLAYILEALTTPIVRCFEGYWPEGGITDWARKRQWARREKSSDTAKYNCFPIDSGRLKPTRLGNVLVAAEDYPFQLYRMDAVLWWPRIAALLPEGFRMQVDEPLRPCSAC